MADVKLVEIPTVAPGDKILSEDFNNLNLNVKEVDSRVSTLNTKTDTMVLQDANHTADGKLSINQAGGMSVSVDLPYAESITKLETTAASNTTKIQQLEAQLSDALGRITALETTPEA